MWSKECVSVECDCDLPPPPLYMALTPSGMMTARAVPTSSPAPSTVTNFSFSWNHNDIITRRYKYSLHYSILLIPTGAHGHNASPPPCCFMLPSLLLIRTGPPPPAQPSLCIHLQVTVGLPFLLSPWGVHPSAVLEILMGGNTYSPTAILSSAAWFPAWCPGHLFPCQCLH